VRTALDELRGSVEVRRGGPDVEVDILLPGALEEDLGEQKRIVTSFEDRHRLVEPRAPAVCDTGRPLSPGGPAQEVDVVQLVAARSVGHAGPQVRRHGEAEAGLRGGADLDGEVRGHEGPVERAVGVPARCEVLGHVTCCHRVVTRRAAEDLGVGEVRGRIVLARSHLGHQDFAQERVKQPHGFDRSPGYHALVHRLRERPSQVEVPPQAGDDFAQDVHGPGTSADGQDASDPPGVGRQGVPPCQDGVSQPRRHLCRQLGRPGWHPLEEQFGEVGVPAGPLVDCSPKSGRSRLAKCRHLLERLVLRHPRQRQLSDAFQSAEVGEPLVKQAADGAILCPQEQQETQAPMHEAGRDEGEGVESRSVSPLEVVDDEDGRRGCGEAAEEALGAAHHVGLAEFPHGPGEQPVGHVDEGITRLPALGPVVGRSDQRHVGNAGRGEVDAGAPEGGEPTAVGGLAEFARKRGLPGTGFALQNEHATVPLVDVVQEMGQLGALRAPTDHHAERVPRHPPSLHRRRTSRNGSGGDRREGPESRGAPARAPDRPCRDPAACGNTRAYAAGRVATRSGIDRQRCGLHRW
jgi:hypothetical protein